MQTVPCTTAASQILNDCKAAATVQVIIGQTDNRVYQAGGSIAAAVFHPYRPTIRQLTTTSATTILEARPEGKRTVIENP